MQVGAQKHEISYAGTSGSRSFLELVWLSNVYPVIFRLEAEYDAFIWNLVGLSEGLLMCVKTEKKTWPSSSSVKCYGGFVPPLQRGESVEVQHVLVCSSLKQVATSCVCINLYFWFSQPGAGQDCASLLPIIWSGSRWTWIPNSTTALGSNTKH